MDPLKCHNCGKTFKDARDLRRHGNRKTPCLIHELSEEDKIKPHCIFCNRIYKSQKILKMHLKKCKVKNGGMDVLVEKIRVLEEEMKEIKDKIKDDGGKITNNTFINNTTNINIIFNNYNNPSIDKVIVTPEEISQCRKLSRLMMEKIYFNESIPENHSVYLKNKKEKSMIVYENGWRFVQGKNISNVILGMSNFISLKAYIILKQIYATENDFVKLPMRLQVPIRDFNTFQDIIADDDIFELAIANKSMIQQTLKHNDCQLIK